MTTEIPALDDGSEEAASAIGWLELFFDLVVVAAVAILAHGLRTEPTAYGLGIFVLLYAAIWMTWVNVVLYADVSGKDTRVRTVLVVMFLVAVMASTVPLHHEERANAFAIAFVLARVYLSRGSMRSGKVLGSWPLLQFGGFTIPWIVSLWPDPPWKYALWALAIVVDLTMTIVRGDEQVDRQVESMRKQYDQRAEAVARRQERVGQADAVRGRSREPRRRTTLSFPALSKVDLDTEHVDERLGLLVIIVLGEAVVQLVDAGAEVTWDRPFVVTAVGAFAVLVGLWLLTFAFGYAGSPTARLGHLPPRFGLPLHLLSTLGILVLAAGLGELAASEDGGLHGLLLWLMCGGLALHFGVGAVSGRLTGSPASWVWQYAVPTTLFPLLVPPAVLLLGEHRGGAAAAWLLVLPIAWQLIYARRHTAAPI